MVPGGFAGCQRQQCALGPSAAVVRPPQPLLSQAVSAASAPRALSPALGKRLSRATQRLHGARLVSTAPRPVWAWLPSSMRNISNDAHQHGGKAAGSFFARMIGRELRNRWTRSDECDRFSLTLPLPPTTVSHNSATAVIWRCLVTSPCTASLAARLATADYLLRPSTCCSHHSPIGASCFIRAQCSKRCLNPASIQPQSTPTRPSPSPACWYWFSICHTVSSNSPPKSHPKSLSVPVPTVPSIFPPMAGGGAMLSCTALRSL